MPVTHSASYPAEPAQVLAIMTDEAFLREYAAGLGATVDDLEITREGDTVRTTVRLRTSTRGIPTLFQKFVGGQVAVLDVRSWQPDAAGGQRGEWSVSAEIMGREAALRGVVELADSAGTTLATTTAEASVDAPVVGRQAEAAVRQLAEIILRRETEAVLRRLGAAEATDAGPG